MTNQRDERFERILNDAADLLRDGFRRPRESSIRKRGGVSESYRSFRPDAPASGAMSAVAGASDAGATRMAEIAREIADCGKCGLSTTRSRAVPGEGAISPLVLVVGEGPGAEEDRTGRPFVGAAGRYLDKWLDAVGLSRKSNCFIANVVKCRPPGNRDPRPEERASCLPFLERQVAILKPRVILTLGRVAIQSLLGTARGIGALRGGTYEFLDVPVVPTYHPSGVLRNPDYRRDVWDDLRRLKSMLADLDA